MLIWLADLLRTDGHRWRELAPQSDSIRALRALVRSRDDLVSARVALSNQLRSSSKPSGPARLCIFADISSPIGLAFLRRYPLGHGWREAYRSRFGPLLQEPALQRPAQRSRVAGTAALRGHGLAGAQTNDEQQGSSCARWWRCSAGGATRRSHTPHRALRGVLARRADRDVLPRAGHVCAAQILSELGDVRERFPSADQLAAEAGTVPVTYQSGKDSQRGLPMGSNHRLRQAIHVGRQLSSCKRVGA